MKKKRQEQIIEIIQNHEVETQEDLAGYLTEAGYAVTQATVSRDIRELSLEKVPGQKVRQKYAMRSTIPVAAEIKHPAHSRQTGMRHFFKMASFRWNRRGICLS